MFSLLSELIELKEEQEINKVQPLLESVETLLRNLVAKIKNKPDAFLQHIDIEILAPQLAGLMLLGKAENRDSIDDFAKLEEINGKKLSQNFFNFLRDIDELHSDKLFDEGQLTANKFLNYVGSTLAKSLTEDWKKILLRAKDGDADAITKVTEAVTKLNEYYSTRFRELSHAFMDKQGDQAFSSAPQKDGIDGAMSGLDVES